jgi:methyl coenzyme M reductase gamma subunit
MIETEWPDLKCSYLRGKKVFCHSERSEESLFLIDVINKKERFLGENHASE